MTEVELGPMWPNVVEKTDGSVTISPPGKEDTLAKMLGLLTAADDCLVELTPDQMEELVKGLEAKVDGCKYILDKFDAEIARVRAIAAEFSAVARVLENNKKHLKENIKFHMKQQDFETLPGQKFMLKRIESTGVNVFPLYTPTSADNHKYPTFVKRTYSWSKSEIISAIKLDPKKMEKFGEVVKSDKIQFTVRKGMKDA